MNGDVRWMTVFLDTREDVAPQVEAFWADVTGYTVSSPRGRREEFATLLPPDGDAHLKLQTVVQSPTGGLHLDLHTDDVAALAGRAEELGASASYLDDGYVVCGSPGGMTFCVVGRPGSRAASPAAWPGGRSMVDQVCLDIPPSQWESECRFWSDLTGWELVDRDPDDEFCRMRQPRHLALRVLLQRLDDEQSVVSGHLDLGSDDYLAETERHLSLGATEVLRTPHWVVLEDPSGRVYCVTRHPVDQPAV
jgi:catechol 2,3-dioxygenase-like lactoylglutathione lyase family enzyme